MSRCSVGVDVGGTSIKLGLLDDELTVVARESVPTGPESDPDETIAAMAAAIRRLGADAISEVGVGCAGLVDRERGLLHTSPNLPRWREVPLRDRLSKAVGRPVELINDADAFAVAEGRHGAGKGCRAGLFATLGTGVGGAILIDGELLGGAHGLAGEIGHLSVDVNGEECPCGNRGCLERLVGSARIVERAERLIASGAPGDGIRNAAGGAASPITPRAIARAAAGGDWTARTVYAEVGRILGIALAGLSNVLSLDVIVVGGGVAEAGEPLWDPMRRELTERCMAPGALKPHLLGSRFGVDAGLVGAAAFARARAGG